MRCCTWRWPNKARQPEANGARQVAFFQPISTISCHPLPPSNEIFVINNRFAFGRWVATGFLLQICPPMPTSFPFPAGPVTLRSLRPADLPAFAAYRADPAVCRYQGFDPYTEAEAAAFIADEAQGPVPAPPGAWRQLAIAHAATDALLGDCALHRHADDPTLADVGITLAADQQGQGYATAALRGLLSYCFQALKLRRVVLLVDARNAPMLALAARLGLRREGEFRENGWYKGEWCDEV